MSELERQGNTEHKTRFRNHISIILEQTGAVLAALFILIVTQVFQSLDEIRKADFEYFTGKGFLVFLAVAALFVVSLVSQIFVWSKTYISIEENAVVIEKGSVSKKKNTIGFGIYPISIWSRTCWRCCLAHAKSNLDTNSRSTAESTDVKIVLKKADALWFQREVTRKLEAYDGKFPQETEESKEEAAGPRRGGASLEEVFDFRADIGDIISHGVFSISIVSVVIFLLAVVGTVLSVAEMLGEPGIMETLAGAAATVAVAVIIVLSTLWDTVKDFIRYYDFRAKRRDDKIYIRYGFLKRVEYTIPVDKIQALKLRQSFVARIGRRYMAEIVNVGMGDDQEEQHSFLILYCTQEKLKERLSLLLPEYVQAIEQPTEQMPSAVWAAWSIPAAIYTAFVLCGALVCSQMAGLENRLYIWLAAAVLLICMPAVMFLKYLASGVGAGERFLKIANGFFGRQILSVKYRKIQYAQFSQNFIARAFGIKKGEIHLLAASANAVHSVPYFAGNKEETIKEECSSFKLWLMVLYY